MIRGYFFLSCADSCSRCGYFLCLVFLDSRRSLPSTTIGGGNDRKKNMIIAEHKQLDIIIPPDQQSEIIELKQGAHGRIYIEGARKLQFEAVLSGERAQLEIMGTFAGNNNQEQDITIRVVQDAAHTACNIRFRCALQESSLSRFDGLIRMTERAIDANARLSYRSLLLSNQSRAIPTPRLEVLTKHIVSATHEAAVGTIDQDQLFYLQSRGLSRKEAEKIIVEGFLKKEIGV